MKMKSKDSQNHVTPLMVYLAVGGALLVLTIVTVAVSYVDLGPFNLVVAMGVATAKAMLVALFFMHLYYDNKLFMAVFLSGLLFLGIFIILTMFDTMKRDMIYEEVARPIRPNAIIYEQPTSTDPTDPQH